MKVSEQGDGDGLGGVGSGGNYNLIVLYEKNH